MATTRSLAGDVCFCLKPTCRPKPKAKAEGATAPETLRQKDRDRVMNFWKAGRPIWARFHRRGNPVRSLVEPTRGNLSGPMTEGLRSKRGADS